MKRTLLLVLFLAITPVLRSQILWQHKTSDVFINPETKAVDSQLCITTLSCYDNTCIAGGVVSNNTVFPFLRSTFYKSVDGGNNWFEVAPPILDKFDVSNWGVKKVQQIDELHAV